MSASLSLYACRYDVNLYNQVHTSIFALCARQPCLQPPPLQAQGWLVATLVYARVPVLSPPRSPRALSIRHLAALTSHLSRARARRTPYSGHTRRTLARSWLLPSVERPQIAGRPGDPTRRRWSACPWLQQENSEADTVASIGDEKGLLTKTS